MFNIKISPRAVELATDALQSTWINEGKRVKELETTLRDRFGFVNPQTVNSCTSALHLALLACGVGLGDEVILPAQTFIATGTAVLQTGAKPVFADIDPANGNLNPFTLEEKITPQTKAIMCVHWGGYPCDVFAINSIAGKYNLPVIEDAAHAFGATLYDQPVGSISRYTCFSFQSIKFITSGDGGVICTTSNEKAKEIKRRKWFGIDKEKFIRSPLGNREWDVHELGFKYNMNDITASIALGNLDGAEQRLERRRKNAALYREQLKDVAGVELLEAMPGYGHSYWIFTMKVEKRDAFAKKMKERQIPASVVDLRIDRNSIFGLTKNLPGQEEFNQKQISIPVHEDLNDDDLNTIIHAIQSGW